MTDLRYAVRMLLKAPAFTFIAIATLALGIGANSAIFSVVNAVLLKPPQYQHPEQLIWVWATRKNVPRAFYSIPNFNDTRNQCQSVERWIAFSTWGVNLRGQQETERLQGIRLSPGALQNLGVQAAAGRFFLPEDERAESARVVILSYALWQRRFAGDLRVIGTNQTLNGDTYNVVGILPRNFVIPNAEADVIAPLTLETDPRRGERGTNFLRLMARLKPGVTPPQAQAELAAITDRLREQFPDDNGNLTAPRVLRLQDEIVGEYRQVLFVLFGAVAVVLLIACSNLANLQLARAAARHREMAIRTALGATRWQLLRQLLAEGLSLAFLGGALGLLIASWGKDALLALAPPDFPRATAIAMDGSVLGFCLLVSVLAGLLLGLVPALHSAGANLHAGLQAGSPAAGFDRARGRARNALVVAEVALSLILLVCAGLLIKSFAGLQNVNPGFDSRRALAVRLALPPSKYPTGAAVKSFYDQVGPRLQRIPGVDSLGAASALPMSALNARTEFVISGHPPARPSDVPGAQHRWVTPGYFHALGIPLLRGRDFVEQDNAEGAGVVVIDQALARRFFPEAEPIGAHIQLTLGDGGPAHDYEIIGMVENVKHNSLTEEPLPTFYGPIPQIPNAVAGFLASNFSLVLRTGIEPQSLSEAVRRELRAIDSDVAVSSVRPLEELVVTSVAGRRFNLILLTSFAGTALLLAAGGIYAVIAYLVTARTREIGVRLALGARRWQVLTLIVGQALQLVLIGVALGLFGAFGAARGLSSLLFNTAATDPLTYASVALLLTIVALVASYIPARRAMKVDPIVALRYE